jgi:hypothetical protein
MKLYCSRQIFLFLILLMGSYQTVDAQQCTTTLNPGDSIASAVSSAANGATICLKDGAYGATNLDNISKSSYVTVRSVNKHGARIGSMKIGNSDYIKIQDVVLDSGLQLNACSTNIQILNNDFNGSMTVRADGCTPNNNLNYLIDGNLFDNLGTSTWEGRLGIGLTGSNSGITVSNNTFSGSGPSGNCSDGIFLGGGTGGVRIGPGNIFRDIIQGSCSAHVDAIQDYGAGPGNVIEGNYFINNSVDIGIYDGGKSYTVRNNVFDKPSSDSGQAIQMGGIQGMLMEHNTFINTVLGIGTKSGNTPNSGWVVQNNIFDNSHFTASGDQPGCGSDAIMRYNLKSHGGTTNPTGTNSITGNTVYVGAGSLTNWADWLLAAGSPGKSAGNDGKDMGVIYYGSTSPTVIATPKNLRLE